MPPETIKGIVFIKGRVIKAWVPSLKDDKCRDVMDFYKIYIDFCYFIRKVSYKEDIKYDLSKVFVDDIYIEEIIGSVQQRKNVIVDSFCDKYDIEFDNFINYLPKKDRYFTISDVIEWACIE